MSLRTSLWVTCALCVAAGGCDNPPPGGDADMTTSDDGGAGGPVLKRPSRSSTIALSDDGALVVMVNPDDDSISVFKASDNSRLAKVTVGDEPAGVVLAPDSKTAYVTNRAAATVVRVNAIDTGAPSVSATVPVGSEPIGLALSPTGAKLFVAEHAEGRIAVIDTKTMTVSGTIDAPQNPRALLVTNDGDESDDDETLVVPEFFGEPNANGEAKDNGRTGRVRLYQVSNLSPLPPITFDPIDSGFPKGGTGANVSASPNQLAAVATRGGRIYVTSVSASPEGPTRFDNNVFPVVYVGDLAAAAEVKTGAGTTNLARKVVDAIPAPSATAPRFIPGELSDIDFVPGTTVSYAVARAADIVQRVVWDDAGVQIGSTQNKQIDLAGNDTLGRCQNPTGIAVNTNATRAYVNCWVTRRLGVIDLASQSLQTTIESSPPPQGATEQAVQKGKRFYFTGRGRWSNAGTNGAKGGEGWSSCGSCHPDGLTDNITWIFASGPRQTTSQDGSFSHGAVKNQRIFNWTGIFDEHHDFERNTRDVSGGLGAITRGKTSKADCGAVDKEDQIQLTTDGLPPNGPPPTNNIAGLGRPLKELADDTSNANNCNHKDWDEIDEFVKTVRPPSALKFADAAAVGRGKQLFADGGCAKCHGGPGWTISRRFYSPTGPGNTTLANTGYTPRAFFPATWSYPNGAGRNLISAQPIIAADATGPAEPAVVPIAQPPCTLRNVGTFGVPNDTVLTDALEVRPFNGMLVRSEGRGGYNVPSLYGLALGAPYLHHGQAKTLEDLLTDTKWQFHTNAGNGNFSVQLAMDAKSVPDLKTYLLSIDAAAAEVNVPTDNGTGLSFDNCP
jgi:YVTN family beta-propeller protein